MKRAFLLTWVFIFTSAMVFAKDAKDPEFLTKRKAECEKMSKEFANHASELEAKSKNLEEDVAKDVVDLAKIKREESENFAELAEAFDKKQWSTITRLEKKGGKLCDEWSEKWAKFEKKNGGELKEKKPAESHKKPEKPSENEPQGKPEFQKIHQQSQGLGNP